MKTVKNYYTMLQKSQIILCEKCDTDFEKLKEILDFNDVRI